MPTWEVVWAEPWPVDPALLSSLTSGPLRVGFDVLPLSPLSLLVPASFPLLPDDDGALTCELPFDLALLLSLPWLLDCPELEALVLSPELALGSGADAWLLPLLDCPELEALELSPELAFGSGADAWLLLLLDCPELGALVLSPELAFGSGADAWLLLLLDCPELDALVLSPELAFGSGADAWLLPLLDWLVLL